MKMTVNDYAFELDKKNKIISELKKENGELRKYKEMWEIFKTKYGDFDIATQMYIFEEKYKGGER